MDFITFREKNGDLTILRIDSIIAVYKEDGYTAIDYGDKQTIYLDVPIEYINAKMTPFIYTKGGE